MTIDIDDFLSRYSKEDELASQPQKQEEKKEEDISLDFQQDLSEKLKKIQELANTNDFEMILKIYEEIKNFDQELPSKLYGLNALSGATLESVGAKYTGDFLAGIKNLSSELDKQIKAKLAEIDSNLNTSNFDNIIRLYNDVVSMYNQYPEEFLTERLELSRAIRRKEVEIHERLDFHKSKEIQNIKSTLGKMMKDLKANMMPGNIDLAEEKLNDLIGYYESIPKIYLTEMLREKIFVSNFLIEAEKFMEREYERDFKEKVDTIHSLFDNFHTHCIKKDANAALLAYDEIIVVFQKIPDVFFEKKLDIYRHINEAFDKLNNLLMTNNISTFLQSFNNSKVLQEAKDYLNHVKLTRKYNVRNINEILAKLKNIPSSVPEKDKLEKSLYFLLNKKVGFPEKIDSIDRLDINLTSENTSEHFDFENPKKNQEYNDLHIIKNSSTEEPKIMKTGEEPLNGPNSKPIEGIREDKEGNLFRDANKQYVYDPNTKYNDEKVVKNILDEIRIYFDRIKKTENKKEIKTLYNKINFYLSLIPIEKKKLDEFKTELNNIVRKKY